jgi:hypothetical protein
MLPARDPADIPARPGLGIAFRSAFLPARYGRILRLLSWLFPRHRFLPKTTHIRADRTTPKRLSRPHCVPVRWYAPDPETAVSG